MANKYMFNEIMRNKSEVKGSLILAIDNMAKYCKDIKLLTDEKNNVFYQVETKHLIDVDENELLKLNQSGWVLSDDTNFLEFYV